MPLSEMIKALHEAGWSQGAIARVVGTSQVTIHRAAGGADIRYSTGREIERLYLRVMRDKRAA